MYPERDSRADEFDDAVERRRSGDNESIEDPELRDLVELASRLEDTLPEELPDPEFRNSLKQDLLSSEPEFDAIPAPDDPAALEQPVPWYHRFVSSPWRTSAAAAACLMIVVVALMATANPFGWGTGGSSEEVTSFQPVGFGDGDGPFADQYPLDTEFDGERWLSGPFPPLDVEHVVIHPMLLGFLPIAERHRPEVELNGATDMVDASDMPSSVAVYYFNAPPSGAALLTALGSTLRIDGELVEGDENGTPYRWVDDDENDIMRWDPTSAFFHFDGESLNEPVDDILDPGAEPEEIAQRFLEMIGFDFMTIEYEVERVDNQNDTEIRFKPADLPDIGLELELGGSVRVDETGAVLEAQFFWLSQVDIEVVGLRDLDDIIEDIQHDHGYAPPALEAVEISIDAADVGMVHVLTRLDDSIFVLQPAVKISGEYQDEVGATLPGPARYLVSAVEYESD